LGALEGEWYRMGVFSLGLRGARTLHKQCLQGVAMNNKVLALASLALAAAFSTPARAQVEIQWWHAMGGALGEWVNDLARDFNASQKDYKIVPTFKGTYTETMTAAIAAFRSGNAPHILQVFEVGTATMMASKGAIVP